MRGNLKMLSLHELNDHKNSHTVSSTLCNCVLVRNLVIDLFRFETE